MDEITDQLPHRLASLLQQAEQDRAAVRSAGMLDGVACYDRLFDSLTAALENLGDLEVTG